MRTVVTTSWDDGSGLDLKLAELLSERGIRATFYCAPRNRERPALAPAELRELAGSFEIGGHSLTHPDLCALSRSDLMAEVHDGKRELEDALGRPVEMFAYPKGRYNGRVRRAVVDCGFLGARTVRMFRFDLPRDPYLAPTTVAARACRWGDWLPHCVRSVSWVGLRELLHDGRGKPWRRLACHLFGHALRRGGVWHLWGHSWEIEERGLWDELRAVLDAVSGHDQVAYLTNGEVVRMARSAGG